MSIKYGKFGEYKGQGKAKNLKIPKKHSIPRGQKLTLKKLTQSMLEIEKREKMQKSRHCLSCKTKQSKLKINNFSFLSPSKNWHCKTNYHPEISEDESRKLQRRTIYLGHSSWSHQLVGTVKR